ncbi:MAG TPA: HAD family hydrolase [Frankiaceae bacterium]|jgi:putative hydrolase of the HAD superfamily|nr:HAD family hydrolase [Frankiaceae bacterium]
MIETVTFDYWNTLCREASPGAMRDWRVGVWSGLLEDAGFATERAVLDRAFEDAWDTFVQRWTAGEHFSYTEAAAGIVEALGHDLPPDVHESLVEAFGRAGAEARIDLTPNVATTIRALKERGIKVGIVCDVGMTPSTALRKHLARHGLLDAFDHWSFSDEVGCYKPDPTIFEHALAGLGARAETTAHVGDLRRTDVAGALGMGMTAIRYTGVYDDDSQPEPEGHHVIADHADLPAIVAG